MRLVQHNGSVQATDHGLRVADVAHEHRLLAHQDSTGGGALAEILKSQWSSTCAIKRHYREYF